MTSKRTSGALSLLTTHSWVTPYIHLVQLLQFLIDIIYQPLIKAQRLKFDAIISCP
jgi:hypothetical protein